jgi:hypothetical protein
MSAMISMPIHPAAESGFVVYTERPARATSPVPDSGREIAGVA